MKISIDTLAVLNPMQKAEVDAFVQDNPDLWANEGWDTLPDFQVRLKDGRVLSVIANGTIEAKKAWVEIPFQAA